MSPSSPLFQRRPWSIQIGPPRDYHSHTGKLLHLVDYRLLATLASYAQFCRNSENCLHYMQWAPHKDGHLTEVLEWQKTELVVSPVAANVCRTVLTHNVSKPQDVRTHRMSSHRMSWPFFIWALEPESRAEQADPWSAPALHASMGS